MDGERFPRRIGLLHQGDRWWFAGVNYLHTLLRQFALLESPPSCTLLLKRGLDDLYAEVECDRISFDAFGPIPMRQRLGRLRRGQWARTLATAATRSRCEVIFPLQHSPGVDLLVPWVGWIPDLQHRVLPPNYTDRERQERDRRMGDLLERAKLVVMSSRSSRRDAVAFSPASELRLRVVPFASVPPEAWWSDDPVRTASELGLPARFMLFPAQGWPSKGHDTLIAALTRLRDIHVLLTGFDPRDPARGRWIAAMAERAGVGDRLTMLGFRSRREVFALLRRAVAIVQPSRFEGWSLLVEDAIAAGRPLVLSDLEVHREQAPQEIVPVHWFAPGDDAGLEEALAEAWRTHAAGPQPDLAVAGRQASIERGRASARLLLAVLGEAIEDAGQVRPE